MEVRGKKNATAGLQGGFGTACKASGNLDKAQVGLTAKSSPELAEFPKG